MLRDSDASRCEVVQLTGAKLARERKRTAELAQTLPRGIKIGQRKDGRAKPFYVRYGHPRKTESFAGEQQRNDRAVELRDAKEEHGTQVMRFDPKEWAEFQRWKAERARMGVGILVKDAVASYVAQRAKAGMSEDGFSHTKLNLSRFVETYGEMALRDIRAEHVRVWLETIAKTYQLGPTTLRHHRKDLNTFFRRAVKAEQVQRNPCELVDPPPVTLKEEVHVLQLREAFQFMKANRDERAIGKLALELFGGIRHSFAGRTVKADLLFDEGGIVLPGAGRKIKRRHVIDGWPRCLWKWLRHSPDNCWTLSERNYTQHKTLAFARGNVKNPGNVLRHTFPTMHLAAFKNPGALLILMTHKKDLDVFQAHYRGRGVSQKVALAFFKITPATVRMSFERFCRLCGIPQTPPTHEHRDQGSAGRRPA